MISSSRSQTSLPEWVDLLMDIEALNDRSKPLLVLMRRMIAHRLADMSTPQDLLRLHAT